MVEMCTQVRLRKLSGYMDVCVGWKIRGLAI